MTGQRCPRHTARGWDPRLVVELHHLHGLVVEADLHPGIRDRYLAAAEVAQHTAELALGVRTGTFRHPDPWLALARVAPELGEWAAYFAAVQPRVRAVRERRLSPREREADDLVRDAERFWDAVAGLRPRRLAPVRDTSAGDTSVRDAG